MDGKRNGGLIRMNEYIVKIEFTKEAENANALVKQLTSTELFTRIKIFEYDEDGMLREVDLE